MEIYAYACMHVCLYMSHPNLMLDLAGSVLS